MTMEGFDPLAMTRRQFFGRIGAGSGMAALGPAALASLAPEVPVSAALRAASFGRARRVIWLFQSGAPSTIDLFDPKPKLREQHGEPLPEHVRGGQRLTGMSSYQSTLAMAGSPFEFAQHGESGAWISELLPNIAGVADKLCFVKSMFTEAINHDPAVTFVQTGSEQAGRPSMGAWLSYGLGSMNQDLPAFMVLTSAGQGGQPLYSRLWGSGFLDSRYQGVRLRSGKDAVLYLSNPAGLSNRSRRAMLDALGTIDREQAARELDPEIESRIAQYELAYRMQTSVPGLTDLSDEPDETYTLYGEDARRPGTYAANCLLARRMAEAGVRFIQLYHQGWDHHSNLPRSIVPQAREVDRASAGLIVDLERRGLLEDTLVIWGGEFGRTAYSQGPLTATNFGRDHHPRCFTAFMAGGGVRAGASYGRTDDYGYNIVDASGAVMQPSKHRFTDGAVHVHDLQATILHLLGVDHRQLYTQHQGRRFRLTDVHGHVVPELLG